MLRLYNTMTRRKEVFTSREPGVVRFFTCGPSVYQPSHLGNYRTFLYEDILHRYLQYLGYRVERVLPFTDVEDKAIAEATRQGVPLLDLTDRVAVQFLDEMRMLRIHPPTHNPRASTTVSEAADIIRRLLTRGYAYRHGKDIFFEPQKYPGFGRLARIDLSRWPARTKRFRKDTYPGIRWNYGDFILWHGERKGDTVAWETGIGRGRPSWNVQDPAMILPFLGPAVDIHAGGIDNLARHHDYTLAIIEALTGKPYAHYWLHGEHLLIGGKKMSKSRGNIVYPGTLLADGFTPEQIRFFLIHGHYRDRMNLSMDSLHDSAAHLVRVQQMAASLGKGTARGKGEDAGSSAMVRTLTEGFEERMDDDLDVRGAWDRISETVSALTERDRSGQLGREAAGDALSALHRIDGVLQVIFPVTAPAPEPSSE